LSPFLLGTQVFDPFANVFRNFNELARRGRVLHDIVCPDEHLPPLPPDVVPAGGGPEGGCGGAGADAGGVGGATGMTGGAGRSGGSADAGVPGV